MLKGVHICVSVFRLESFNERFLQHCGTEEGENWCDHLAMILSNHTRFKHLHKKTITNMGDALGKTKHYKK